MDVLTAVILVRRLRALADRVAALCKDLPPSRSVVRECKAIVLELHEVARGLTRVHDTDPRDER